MGHTHAIGSSGFLVDTHHSGICTVCPLLRLHNSEMVCFTEKFSKQKCAHWFNTIPCSLYSDLVIRRASLFPKLSSSISLATTNPNNPFVISRYIGWSSLWPHKPRAHGFSKGAKRKTLSDILCSAVSCFSGSV